MRHRKSNNSFGRPSAQRKALFVSLANALIKGESGIEMIKTTLPKAKKLRGFVEPLITIAKVDSVANRRLIFNRLRSKETVGKLFTVLGPHFKNRPGGYLRILKCGYRHGDNAPMAYVQMVGREQVDKATES